MIDSLVTPAALQRRINRLSQSRQTIGAQRVATGHAAIDQVLNGGFSRGKLHEIVVETSDHASSGAGFAGICARLFGGPIVWLRLKAAERSLHPAGLREIGVDPGQILLIVASDTTALLRAAGDVLRCSAVGAVVIELWGQPQCVDLTASRRLVLSAETSGVTALLLRIAVTPLPNAAQTRWAVRSAPSSSVAEAPGYPAFDLDLLRQRSGPSGMHWRVEWDRDANIFRAPLSGAVDAVPARRSLADNAGTRLYGIG